MRSDGTASGTTSRPVLSGDGRTLAFTVSTSFADVPGSFPYGPIIRHLGTGTTSDLRRMPSLGGAASMPGPLSLSDDGRRVASIPYLLAGEHATGDATVRDTTSGAVLATLGSVSVPIVTNRVVPLALSGDGASFALGFVPPPGGPTRGALRVGKVAAPSSAREVASEYAADIASVGHRHAPGHEDAHGVRRRCDGRRPRRGRVPVGEQQRPGHERRRDRIARALGRRRMGRVRLRRHRRRRPATTVASARCTHARSHDRRPRRPSADHQPRAQPAPGSAEPAAGGEPGIGETVDERQWPTGPRFWNTVPTRSSASPTAKQMPDFERAASTTPVALPSTETTWGSSESPAVKTRLVSARRIEAGVTLAYESVSARIVFAFENVCRRLAWADRSLALALAPRNAGMPISSSTPMTITTVMISTNV